MKRNPPISIKWMLIGILLSFIGSLITILLDLFVFSPLIEVPDGQSTVSVCWQGLLAMFYGGITEELMLRLFGMTLIVWLLARITKKDAIILMAIIFAIGHLPATLFMLCLCRFYQTMEI
ncbi:CPBP family intramembrane metalloprotease [Gracilibacillus oryzae]|uniref:CPBP family intramembrane metalloprotease n=1 Tax=Gracilibacillus oryzae TaxID=1672701 RepID=A0A7C8GT92_9BACI|nr:CPBP family glutamic-type intramembrane protease [Gracilibacillus oryzae]KAB8135771.1 CPBP family intramembrane metalloprotease [Gracilibacillus oryzae]